VAFKQFAVERRPRKIFLTSWMSQVWNIPYSRSIITYELFEL